MSEWARDTLLAFRWMGTSERFGEPDVIVPLFEVLDLLRNDGPDTVESIDSEMIISTGYGQEDIASDPQDLQALKPGLFD